MWSGSFTSKQGQESPVWFYGLLQGLANYGTRARSSLPPVSLNNMLLEHKVSHLCVVSGRLCTATAELSGCDRG